MPGAVAAYVSDLIFGTKIASTGRSLGVDVRMVRSADALRELLEAEPASLVLIDLNAAGDPLAAVGLTRLLQPVPRTIAFVSHVQVDLAEQARDAGADEVMARSAFAARLPELLRSACQPRED
jgi:CheY-like chemotaxis protein